MSSSDWIEGYKLGFKEGVEALKTQLKGRLAARKEICEGRWKRYEKEGETDLSAYWCGKDNEIYCVKADIDEICKELEGDK